MSFKTIPSVNFHLWKACNMRCKFCFATFQEIQQTSLPKGHLPHPDAIRVVKELASYGFQKINFAGGEPTLCPWLPELIQTAKRAGMTTTIITNGTHLTTDFLQKNQPYLDWIGVSIDSLDRQTNVDSGRAVAGKRALDESLYVGLFQQLKESGYRTKINTVVHRLNYQEDMRSFIARTNPERWKVFQVLRIEGENDHTFPDFSITASQYKSFLHRHQVCSQLVPEENTAMIGSYVMVNPAGQFYNNLDGLIQRGPSIAEVGCARALRGMEYSTQKFLDRGGMYSW